MKQLHRARDILTGAAAMALVFSLASPAGAALAGKTIQVLTGVEIYVDGVEMKPTDANGKPVETFVYNGTTYVPLRAVSQSLGKSVQYDGETQSIYIGEVPGMKQYLMTVCPPYQTSSIETPATVMMAGKKYANVMKCIHGQSDATALFHLNGQYTTLSFDLGHVDDGDSWGEASVDIYLDGELSFSADMGAEELPEHFEVPLYNALQMKFVLNGGSHAIANLEIY